MFQTVKAMMVAGMIAAGLPLLTETASAQAYGWQIIRPQACDLVPSQSGDGSTHTSIYISQQDNIFVVVLNDVHGTSALLKMCYDGSAFYGFYDSYIGRWTDFYIIQGLR